VNFNDAAWSDYQKVAAQLKSQAIGQMPPFFDPSLTQFLQPLDAKQFVATPPLNIAFPVPGAAAVTVLSYQAPVGTMAVINELAVTYIGANPPDGQGNMTWSLLINGGAVKGLNNQTRQLGTDANPNAVNIRLIEGDIASIILSVPAGKVAPVGTLTARFMGWTYPISEAVLPNPAAS
jgi:hypothetical protein